MTKFIAVSCEFRLTEDDWCEGEGNAVSTWNEDIAPSDSIGGLLGNVPYLDCDYAVNARSIIDVGSSNGIFVNDPIEEGDYSRFDGDLAVDMDEFSKDPVKPTPEKWEKFQKGECRLFNLHIVIYVKKVMDLDENDIVQLMRI